MIQVNENFHKLERVYRDCIKRTRDKARPGYTEYLARSCHMPIEKLKEIECTRVNKVLHYKYSDAIVCSVLCQRMEP